MKTTLKIAEFSGLCGFIPVIDFVELSGDQRIGSPHFDEL